MPDARGRARNVDKESANPVAAHRRIPTAGRDASTTSLHAAGGCTDLPGMRAESAKQHLDTISADRAATVVGGAGTTAFPNASPTSVHDAR